ncbi:phosphopyruvate hydratase [Halobacteriaceae archaeon SHR40]|uniref:phosphopyruvate hydratase n=1 Tax=Halovenus amylolytica TaxID=2500550 RepID=UPI000FE39D63
MTLLTDVQLRPVLDSRGNATVEADVTTEDGGFGRAAAPSGASTGEYEAIELPARESIEKTTEHALPHLEGEVDVNHQRDVDNALHEADGTGNFSEIGANSAVAISMAAAKAGADSNGVPLYKHLGGAFRGENFPIPFGNVIGGGEHAKDATDIQEFLGAPVGAPTIEDAVFANANLHATVGDILDERGVGAGKGDEGAWAPPISDADAFEIMEEAVTRVEEDVGFEIRFGLDVAASEMYEDGEYVYSDTTRSPEEQIEYMADLIQDYDLIYCEDPLDENDFEGTAELTEAVSDTDCRLCGDDLFVTNVSRLQEGIDTGAGNTILIKPNQIGSMSDTMDAIELAVRNGYETVISHRSGETEDTTIAHIAVATDAGFIKTGAVAGERTAKLNELMRIADRAA